MNNAFPKLGEGSLFPLLPYLGSCGGDTPEEERISILCPWPWREDARRRGAGENERIDDTVDRELRGRYRPQDQGEKGARLGQTA